MTSKIAKPFLKWAGGKTQLINEIERSLPFEITNNKFTYVEPFVGSGAVLFWMLSKFPNLEKAIINDINADLINTYNVIAEKPKKIIKELKQLHEKYHLLKNNETKQLEYYLEKRKLYNTRNENKIMQAALFIFLNKSCFNGIYRVNSKNEFNVPKGSSVTPPICDEENILAVSQALKKVTILSGDYQNTLDHTSENTFFYFDPPYKPLSKTSSFNSYTKENFDDAEQIRLKEFCVKVEQLGHKWMMSNSDVKGKDNSDDFFDELYAKFKIERVQAKRSLNAHGDKRGKLSELLITNYNYEQALQTA
ncbi:MAG: DNA adenine methylase [Bacteroidota bacterium]